MQKITFSPTIYPFQIDFMRHVSNIVYIQWVEMGRCLLLDEVGMSISTIAEQGFGPVLVDTTISYKRQLRLGDKVLVELWIAELSNASAWLAYSFKNGEGEVAATGRQRGLFMHIETGRPRRMTTEDRAKFELYLVDTK